MLKELSIERDDLIILLLQAFYDWHEAQRFASRHINNFSAFVKDHIESHPDLDWTRSYYSIAVAQPSDTIFIGTDDRSGPFFYNRYKEVVLNAITDTLPNHLSFDHSGEDEAAYLALQKLADAFVLKSEREYHTNAINELDGAVDRLRYLVSLVPDADIRRLSDEYDVQSTVDKVKEQIDTICNLIASDYGE